jgi:hypothetical protein
MGPLYAALTLVNARTPHYSDTYSKQRAAAAIATPRRPWVITCKEATTVGPFSHDDELDALRRRFPGWDVYRVFGGWAAVPAGTPFIRGMFLESVAEKIGAVSCACGHAAVSHWEVAEPGGGRAGCAVLGCPCEFVSAPPGGRLAP